jgi:hypothetical protein
MDRRTAQSIQFNIDVILTKSGCEIRNRAGGAQNWLSLAVAQFEYFGGASAGRAAARQRLILARRLVSGVAPPNGINTPQFRLLIGRILNIFPA